MKYFQQRVSREFTVGEDGKEHENMVLFRSWWEAKPEVEHQVRKLENLITCRSPAVYSGIILFATVAVAGVLMVLRGEETFPFGEFFLVAVYFLSLAVGAFLGGCWTAIQVRSFCLRINQEFPGILTEIQTAKPELAERLDQLLPKEPSA